MAMISDAPRPKFRTGEYLDDLKRLPDEATMRAKVEQDLRALENIAAERRTALDEKRRRALKRLEQTWINTDDTVRKQFHDHIIDWEPSPSFVGVKASPRVSIPK